MVYGPDSITLVGVKMFADLILLLGLVYCIYEIRALNLILDRRGNVQPTNKDS